MFGWERAIGTANLCAALRNNEKGGWVKEVRAEPAEIPNAAVAILNPALSQH